MIFNYWLDPLGILHDAGNDVASHNAWAKQYLIDKNGEEWFSEWLMSDKRSYPYQELHKMGWVRITIDKDREQVVRVLGDGIDMTKPMKNTVCPAMNDLQMRIVKIICEQEDFEFHKAVNDKRFW